MSSSESSDTPRTSLSELIDIKTDPKISKKLCDENDYPAWAIEAERHIFLMDLESVVTGENKDQPTISGEVNAWKKKTYKALNYIIESCELKAQLKIRSAISAAQAWKIL